MKKYIAFIIAAAMLSAGVYAETVEDEIVEVATAVAKTTVPGEEQVYYEEEPVPPDVPPEDIAFEEPVGNDIANEEPFDAAYTEDILPEEELPTEDDNYVEPFPELGDVYQYLEANGYPEYLSFICNTAAAINGYDPTTEEEYQPKMTYWWDVGVVNATSAQKAEIQALIDELYPIENILDFVDCTYSYNERKALIPEIRQTVEELFPDIKVIDVSLIRNTEQIALQLDFSTGVYEDVIEAEMVKEKMYAIYGDLLFMGEFAEPTYDDGIYDGAVPETAVPTVGIGEIGVEEEDEVVDVIDDEGTAVATNYDGEAALPAFTMGGDLDAVPADGDMTTSEEMLIYGEVAAITSPAEQSRDNTILWVCIAAALVIGLGTVAFIYRAKLIPVFATSHGDVTAKKTSKKQAEDAVKNSEVIPDDSVLQTIKEKIDK